MAIDDKRCPLCGASYDNPENTCSMHPAEVGGNHLNCAYYDRKCIVDESIDSVPGDEDAGAAFKRYNLIVAFLLKKPFLEHDSLPKYWNFFYDEGTIGEPMDSPVKVNIANNMVDYPNDFYHRVDRVLLALSGRYPTIGDLIRIHGNDRALYYVTNNDLKVNWREIQGVLERLSELGYLRERRKNVYYEITANGWLRISELQRAENEISQGFIAMAFRAETEEIGKAFQEAISESGYIPRRIDEKEHNNQIVPEIFYEIKRSKFLVVDVTYLNYGAYYEAGYGEALNKQVIVCCSKEVFDKGKNLHFDIAQKSAVVWADLDDLKRKLKIRIEATVGRNYPK